LPEAAALWSQAHALLPHDPEPVVAYAEIALAAGDAAAAPAAIENGLALMPDEAFLHRALAALLHRGGDEDGARHALAVAERCVLGAKRTEGG
jgi:Flp pilus assembly protein TadD